jgi:ABC-type methionine transport system permease subunit
MFVVRSLRCCLALCVYLFSALVEVVKITLNPKYQMTKKTLGEVLDDLTENERAAPFIFVCLVWLMQLSIATYLPFTIPCH